MLPRFCSAPAFQRRLALAVPCTSERKQWAAVRTSSCEANFHPLCSSLWDRYTWPRSLVAIYWPRAHWFSAYEDHSLTKFHRPVRAMRMDSESSRRASCPIICSKDYLRRSSDGVPGLKHHGRSAWRFYDLWKWSSCVWRWFFTNWFCFGFLFSRSFCLCLSVDLL